MIKRSPCRPTRDTTIQQADTLTVHASQTLQVDKAAAHRQAWRNDPTLGEPEYDGRSKSEHDR